MQVPAAWRPSTLLLHHLPSGHPLLATAPTTSCGLAGLVHRAADRVVDFVSTRPGRRPAHGVQKQKRVATACNATMQAQALAVVLD
jgi:hypothetical protein